MFKKDLVLWAVISIVCFSFMGCSESSESDLANKNNGLTNSDQVQKADEEATAKTDASPEASCDKLEYQLLSQDNLWMKSIDNNYIDEFRNSHGRDEGYEVAVSKDALAFYIKTELISEDKANSIDFDHNVVIAAHLAESGVVLPEFYVAQACQNGTVRFAVDQCKAKAGESVAGSGSLSWPFILIEVPKDSYQDIEIVHNMIECQ